MQGVTRVRAIALACVGLFVIAACGGGGGNANVKEGGTLIYAIDADAQTLNPFEASDLPSVRALMPMLVGLYQLDKNLALIPDLATGPPDISSDLKTWTVKMRTDAKWSDGTPITANDVVVTDRIQASSKLDTDASFDWSPLTDPVNGITAKDDHTVVFTLTTPFAPFYAVNLAGFVAPASVFGSVDPANMRTFQQDHPTVTGGPFMFDKRVAGSEIDLKANPNYYGGKPHIAAIVEKVITNSTAAVQAVINGDINWDPEITASGIDTVKAASTSRAPNTRTSATTTSGSTIARTTCSETLTCAERSPTRLTRIQSSRPPPTAMAPRCGATSSRLRPSTTTALSSSTRRTSRRRRA